MRRRILLLSIAVAAVLLVPWSLYLAQTLPDRFVTGQWRVAWVGFDAALVVSFAGGVWSGRRRHRAAVPLLAASAALLFCDAWFDVALDWGSADEAASLLPAMLVEVPFGLLLLGWGRRLISGDVRTERLMRRHLRLRGDPWFQRAVQALDRLGPTDVRTAAEEIGADEALVAARLHQGARLGLVQRRRDGRWALPGRLEARRQSEQELLAWADTHRAEFGAWGYGQRVVAHLRADEVARFAVEYRELVSRYRLLHPDPEADTREVGIRCYAFPMPPAPVDDEPAAAADSDPAAAAGASPATAHDQ
ncbi:hypothetical protein [Dactylosporangium sp. NPDC049140]|uniref:hypothetical protein n=1 Tax=Dactylosporangium sp. NPDC049140 TaxID=3155647 RepID=UPI0033E140CC